MTNSAASSAGRTRQIDCEMPSTSPSHCSARCAQSASSAASDEPFEQPQPRRDQVAFVAGTFFDGDADARDARVGPDARALSCGPGRADGQQRGARGRH